MATDNYGRSDQGDNEAQQDSENRSGTNQNLNPRESDRTNYEGSYRDEDHADMDNDASDRNESKTTSNDTQSWNSDDMSIGNSNSNYSTKGSEHENAADEEAGWDRNTDRSSAQGNNFGKTL